MNQMIFEPNQPAPIQTRFRFPVYFLFAESFFMNLGFFMLIPLLSIHYLSLGLTALFVGNLYAVRILSQQGLQLFGGAISDRLPYRLVILLGSIIRAAGFAMFAVVERGPLLYAAACLFGIGGALFGPAGNAALAALVPESSRARAFTIRQATSNIGTTVGPVLGAFLVTDHFVLICVVAGLIFALVGVAGMWILPNQKSSEQPTTLWSGVKTIAKNRVFLRFVIYFMGYYLIYQQMYIAIPDILVTLHPPRAALGELFSLEAILEIAVSYPVIAWMNRSARMRSAPRVMGLGLLIMGVSWLPLVFTVNIATLLAPVVGLSIGSVIALPSRQTYTAALADASHLATYFGVASLSMAVGASVGASGGGLLMHTMGHPWHGIASPASLLFALVSILCAFLLARLPEPVETSREVDSAREKATR
ncbi:MFS transporter [Ferroacidibacillus organovorans]|uniref:MFS transporter n=1 Tax=Ferroacidibacillus organovorans TaxID=1765683 RepID=A0A161QEY3_9BACL|nr:MFS transporter [Ferroacidibacillus organovorans]KYP80420.1 hypothetical protein AYJ22_11205 [Ferroacidibacillus organovorans]OAG93532.1 hypothetical protein AYW79_10175 [Ferroacidibacillus organovorans]OPG15087.1 MFS transporter [Ferroacidibacillus organovorans]